MMYSNETHKGLHGRSNTMIKYSAPILILLWFTGTIDDGFKTHRLQLNNFSVESLTIVDETICKDKRGVIGKAFEDFSSGGYDQSLQARKTLLKIAQQSNNCRQALVGMLMERMDRPNLDFELQPANYYLWREGSELLGELKATEALDLLISHLDLNNGFHSASGAFQPATLGVRQMGEVAVPKLAVALRQSPKPSIRMAAADCLTAIGGVAAMNVLKEAQRGESSSCVANFIKASLDTFSYQRKSGIAFDTRARQADVEARLKVLMARECVE